MEYKWKEATLLVSLLRAALGGETPVLPADTDWENLFALAVQQKVEAMVCAALTDVQTVPQDVRARFLTAYKKEISAQIVRRNEGMKIFNAFEVNGIDCVPLKGWVLQDLYPNPAMRYMCDLDILFKPEQSADVQRVLEALDYVPQELGGNPEVYFKKPIMNIEMHKRIVRDKTDHFDRTWERVVPQAHSDPKARPDWCKAREPCSAPADPVRSDAARCSRGSWQHHNVVRILMKYVATEHADSYHNNELALRSILNTL